jgi:hypothetical protein
LSSATAGKAASTAMPAASARGQPMRPPANVEVFMDVSLSLSFEKI